MRLRPFVIGFISIFLGFHYTWAYPALPLIPVNLDVNTAADEDEPHISPNGLRLFYLAREEGKTTLLADKRKTEKQGWKPGKPPEDLEVITDKRELAGIFLLQETKPPFYIYYAARNPAAKKPNFDIFIAIKSLPGADKVYTEPRALISIDKPEDEAHPWLSVDGQSLYFSRKTSEGWRQYVATRNESTGTAGFNEPEDLGFPAGFHHATLTPDGKTMILQGSLPKDRWGLFISTYENKTWTAPEPLDRLNNPEGAKGDKSPCLSRDGKRLYFASDRPKGKGGLDLWTIPMDQVIKK